MVIAGIQFNSNCALNAQQNECKLEDENNNAYPGICISQEDRKYKHYYTLEQEACIL